MKRNRYVGSTKTQLQVSRASLPALPVPEPAILSDPAKLFLHLTRYTVPYGGEGQYYSELLTSLGFSRDDEGNYFLGVSGDEPVSSCFMAHLDTSGKSATPINRITEGGVCRTDGNTILGADDRAGLTIILSMVLKDTPGLYYLFVGEEVGGAGSGKVARQGLPAHIKRCISFDRRGKTSVITHQGRGRTCSDAFAQELSNALNEYGLEYGPDPTGVYTDSAEFADKVSECTNISVGYQHEHSTRETQDLDFLSYLCSILPLIDWQSLPADRPPGDFGYDWDDYPGYSDDGWRGSACERYFGSGGASKSVDREYDAYEAIEMLVEGIECGMTTDRDLVRRLIQFGDEDTVSMIEMLVDEMQRLFWRK